MFFIWKQSIFRGSAGGYLSIIRNSVTPRSESNHAEHHALRRLFRWRRWRCLWRQRWGQRWRRRPWRRRCLWWQQWRWRRLRRMAIPTTWTRWCRHCRTLMPVAVGRGAAAVLPFPFPSEHGGRRSPVLPPVLAAPRVAEADAGAQSKQDDEQQDGEISAHLCVCSFVSTSILFLDDGSVQAGDRVTDRLCMRF
uniref:Uncharacterized protein n=1 Tax=Aegilops tauschii subsp. strangulata TaxID=200361 RepID=A0A453A059_AEGTS